VNLQTTHYGIRNWDLKQCTLYLTVYVFDFWVENSETEVNRDFSSLLTSNTKMAILGKPSHVPCALFQDNHSH